MTRKAGLAFLAILMMVQPAAAEPTIAVGKSFASVMSGPKVYTSNIDDARNSIPGHTSVMHVRLNAGDAVKVQADVVGSDRQVALLIEDPAGGRTSFMNFNPERVVASVKAVSTTGKYKITVISDKVGDFSVKVLSGASSSDRADAVRQLEEKIERLKAELAEAQEELKSLSAKGSE